MAATRSDIRRWALSGKNDGHDFMIIVCDTFDHDDYPAYTSNDNFRERYDHFNGNNMQQIMEVYDLSLDIEAQLQEKRAFNYPKGFK